MPDGRFKDLIDKCIEQGESERDITFQNLLPACSCIHPDMCPLRSIERTSR